MIKFAVYDNQGIVLRTGHCQETDLALQAGPGETAVENTGGWRDDTHYWNGSAFADRQEMSLVVDKTQILANDVDKSTITGIPIGTVAKVNGEEVVVDDGVLEFSSNFIGVFVIHLQNSPTFKPATVRIKAV